MKEGTITLSPIPKAGEAISGKSASAVIAPDGTFVLGTYSRNDGAIIGRHRVYYSAIAEAGPKMPTPCGYTVTTEIEIVKGDNELTIELSRK